ncbi:alpha/beta hydrolase [Herbaspirillum frisingense]
MGHGQTYSSTWGSEFVEVRAKGHLNSESNSGAWQYLQRHGHSEPSRGAVP